MKRVMLVMVMVAGMGGAGCQSDSKPAQQSGRFGPPSFSAGSPLGSFKPMTGSMGRPVDMGGGRQTPTALPSTWRGFSPTGR